MMNTADRSLALVDYALRRRFAFATLKPMFGETEFTRLLESRGADPQLVSSVSERLQELNDAIAEDSNLGPGFCVGHSYLCSGGSLLTEQVYGAAIENEILPLLEQYWMDDAPQLESWRSKLLKHF